MAGTLPTHTPSHRDRPPRRKWLPTRWFPTRWLRRRWLRSLRFRLLIPLLLTATAVLIAYAELSFRSTREHTLRLVRTDAARSSELVRRATHDGMLLNRKDEVQRTFERLGGGPDVAAVRIYNKQGYVFLSSRRSEIGSGPVDLDAEPCRACHAGGLASPAADIGTTPSLPRMVARERTLHHLSVIENETGCTAGGCHADDASRRVLGVLEVEMSMEPLAQALRTARWQMFGAAGALLVVIFGISTAFVHRRVLQPVEHLRQGTQRVAAGELDTRLDVAGDHELADLADAFNKMAADLEEARRESRNWSVRLEEKVVEKTRDLRQTQRQVLNMERMASLGKLSATVAHELNNPLSGILMYARLVDRELDSLQAEGGRGGDGWSEERRGELGRYLELIQRETRRCGDIVRNLLLFARHGGAEMGPVDLAQVAERSLQLIRHHLEMHDVHLAYRPGEGDLRLVADAGQLEQALVALCVNAVEAMSGSGGELQVELLPGDETVQIRVADTGVGIPEDALPRIFEPFFSTKHEESGVGLGLAVVYGIVERHQGSIEVESALGRGTVFRITFPRRQETEDERQAGGPDGAGGEGHRSETTATDGGPMEDRRGA